MKNFIGLFIMLYAQILGSAASAQSVRYPFQVQKTGTGDQSIIMIPGFGCSGDVWIETRAVLEAKYTCYTLTMAGFAGIPSSDNPTMSNWAKSISEYIQRNHIDKPVIIGHSLGGVLAMSVASEYPSLIGKIIVVDALPCLSALQNPSFQSNRANDCSPIVNQISGLSNEQFAQMQKMNIPALVQDASRYDMIIGWMLKADRKTFGTIFCDFLNTDLRDKVKSIQCPSLILLEAPFKQMSSTMEEQFKDLSTASLRYADKGLHFIMYDDNEWYLNQVREFLN